VATLVAGPGAYICDDFVSLCEFVIKNKPKSVSLLTPWEQVAGLDEVLSNLPRVAAATAQVERNLHAWVHRARALSASWAQIGSALTMTRQSAWERFSGEE
jgi:hypothetical protein